MSSRRNTGIETRLAWRVTGMLLLGVCACSDSTGPSGPLGLLKLDAWACPQARNPTIQDCFRAGDKFDPAVSDSANRATLLVVTARRGNGETIRLLTRVVAEDGQEAVLQFPPMETGRLGTRDLLIDTIAVPPIGRAVRVRVVIQLAAGDTIPFLHLVDDTTFFWF